MQTNKGMVLLMVLAVLTLLCLLGLMFVMMANMERATARAYLDMVRVKMIAQSGIHATMVNTRSLLTEKGFDIEEMEYYGEDLNRDGVVTVGFEAYEDQDNDGTLQILDCPLYRAVHPSFMVDLDQDGDLDQEDLINVQGKWVGVSGVMPGAGPYQPKAGLPWADNPTLGAYYTLKVEDLSGKIFINGVADPFEKQVLERVLDTLTNELLGRPLGKQMVNNAPYYTLDELKTKLGLTEPEFILLKTCITTYAWRDTGVIKPVPIGIRMSKFPPRPGEDVFTWRSIRPLMIEYPTQSIYGRQQIIGRAPVNINTAPQPVLVALLAGLAGLYLDEDSEFTWYEDVHSHLIGYRYDESSPNPQERGSLGKFSYTPEITNDQADSIARAIIQNRNSDPDPAKPWRGTFRSWQQFGLFCNEVLVEGLDHNIPANFLSPQQADVLKANFNPNSNLPEFNPPTQRLFWVGKDNLWSMKLDKYGKLRPTACHSTEFSFFPTGYFLITSLGRLLGPENKVMSEAEIQTAVQLFSLYRETSQKDFLEDFWSRKAPITEVISPNPDPTLQPTTDNLTLQTYPEILEYDSYAGSGYCRGPDTSQSAHLQNPYVQDAHYDGYITLATVENSDTNPAPDFRASYSQNSLQAESGEVVIEDTKGPYVNRLVGPASIVTSFSEQQAMRQRPGTLFPDGVYSEMDGVPAYDYRPSNLNVFTTSLWIKPHFFPEAGSKCRTWFTYQAYFPILSHMIAPLGIYSIPGGHEDNIWKREMSWPNASFFVGGYAVSALEPWASWGGGLVTPALNHIRHECKVVPSHPSHATCGGKVRDPEGNEWGTLFRAGKWLHLGWSRYAAPPSEIVTSNHGYVGNPDYNADLLYINGQRCPPELSYSHHSGSASDHPFPAFDNVLLRLGERRNQFGVSDRDVRLNGAPDGTIDEVLIWDGLTINQGKNAVNEVWEQGRYYRGNDGVFTSRAISLDQHMGLPTGTPITVFMLAWTQYVPYKLTPYEGAGVVDLQAKGATCEIEIWDSDRSQWNETTMQGRIGVRKSTTPQPDPSGELIKPTYVGDKLVVTEPIRYRVKFLPKVDPINDILIDPLIFDDITIIYYSVPKFLSWAYRR